MPTGTRVTRDDVKLVAWPSANPIAGAHESIDSVVGRGLMATVLENEPLTNAKLATAEAGAGLPPSIPLGMRAMSVKVNEVIGVAGFVVPGTRVDLLVTLGQSADRVTRTVVSNVQVLTAGTRYDQEKAKSGEPIPSTVVTLMVTPADAERIALAEAEGEIMLALRNPMDVEAASTEGAHVNSLLGRPAPPPAAPSAAPRVRKPQPKAIPAETIASTPTTYRVEAIRGAKRTEEVVR
jgi:pilus assembly protein CpaB